MGVRHNLTCVLVPRATNPPPTRTHTHHTHSLFVVQETSDNAPEHDDARPGKAESEESDEEFMATVAHLTRHRRVKKLRVTIDLTSADDAWHQCRHSQTAHDGWE